MLPQRFLAKIPNIKVLREFLLNAGGYYLPPVSHFPNSFVKAVLSG